MSSGATLALFARLLLSLVVVFGLMWMAARMVRRRGIVGVGSGNGNRRPGVHVDVIAGAPSAGTHRSRSCAPGSRRWSSA